ncbi:MAG: hypothetical protein CMJ48_01985 [Planctomycetaceae bacterium]|nr:hypothetical protein [Planctomycetaceae bacterium]
MKEEPTQKHDSDSSEQRAAESEILAALEQKWGVQFGEDGPDIDQHVRLDGFADGETPTCVEIWAHQGRAKGGQIGKVMKDLCKLLLVEKLLGKACRKVFAVCDEAAIAFLQNSWQGRFAEEYGIELLVAEISDDARQRVCSAQQRQFR